MWLVSRVFQESVLFYCTQQFHILHWFLGGSSNSLTECYADQPLHSTSGRCSIPYEWPQLLGPDGVPVVFYQKHWAIVGPQVCDAVLFVLNSNGTLADINSTLITLIPKKKAPTKVTEFRPISLCNVLYELISKVVANRFKKILPYIISSSQSDFVPNILISDNVIVAFEALHTMKCKMTRKEGYMALKLDMSKACDRIEWDFLRAVLYKLVFYKQWVEQVMK